MCTQISAPHAGSCLKAQNPACPLTLHPGLIAYIGPWGLLSRSLDFSRSSLQIIQPWLHPWSVVLHFKSASRAYLRRRHPALTTEQHPRQLLSTRARRKRHCSTKKRLRIQLLKDNILRPARVEGEKPNCPSCLSRSASRRWRSTSHGVRLAAVNPRAIGKCPSIQSERGPKLQERCSLLAHSRCQNGRDIVSTRSLYNAGRPANVCAVQVFLACIYCLLAAGVVFGYAAIKPVLLAEGVYRDRCSKQELEDNVHVCYEQELRCV